MKYEHIIFPRMHSINNIATPSYACYFPHMLFSHLTKQSFLIVSYHIICWRRF